MPITTGTLPAAVTASPPLTVVEHSVAQVYLLLFGRVPQPPDLTYWSERLQSRSDPTGLTAILADAVATSLIIDAGETISRSYYNLFGLVLDDDPLEAARWQAYVTAGVQSLGEILSRMVQEGLYQPTAAGETMRNRLLMLEAACRLQKAYGRNLSIQDSRSIVLRVQAVSSYNSAIVDLERLIVNGAPSTALSWGESLTAATLAGSTQTYPSSAVRQRRNLVWYNRQGHMMLAWVYIPTAFTGTGNRVIIGLHGGGWRQGNPSHIHYYAKGLAERASPNYVVISPTYRLTAYGDVSPGQQQDAADFYSLVNSSTFLNKLAGKVGIFGESSGAHLACYVGATLDVHRVFGLYPPVDLTGTPAVSSGLQAFVDYYAPTALNKSQASANLVWAAARTTRFQLWHGLSDTLVPSAQTGKMVTAAGTKCVARYLSGEGHGFSNAGKSTALAAAAIFFDDTQPLAT